MNRKYKYVHVLWHDEIKFNKTIVEFFNDDSNGFDNNEHYFITPCENVYNSIKYFTNVEFIEVKCAKSAELVNLVGDYAEYLVLHNICNKTELIKIKRKNIRKIIFRFWGGNLIDQEEYFPNNSIKNILKNIYLKCYNFRVCYRVKNFKCIGTAGVVDEIYLSKMYDNLKMFTMPYETRESCRFYQNALEITMERSNALKILIGHSGYPDEKHIQMVNRLSRFSNENIEIFLLLSYGNEDYIKNVKDYFIEHKNDKLIIIDEFMTKDQFFLFLKTMDIGIFPTLISNGLGTIVAHMGFHNKVFLDPRGAIAEALEYKKIPYFTVDSINDMTFEEFCKPADYSKCDLDDFCPLNYDQVIGCWKKIIDFCE